jgi:ribose transport system substrate-binding protein
MANPTETPSTSERAEGTRRDFLARMSALSMLALGAGALGACTPAPPGEAAKPAAQGQTGASSAAQPTAAPAAAAAGGGPSAGGKPLKAAFSNAGLGATWCAQGKQAAEQWGKWFNVEITWFDGGLSVDKQRKAIEDMASSKWDFVAIQPFGIGTLVDPVKRMIDAGIPVIQMDTVIAPPEANLPVLTFLEPDNVYMGSVSTEAMLQSIGGKGQVIMTQGAAGHTGAQGRAQGFKNTIAKYPDVQVVAQDFADWDVNKVAKLWEDYLVKYPDVKGAFFHNDDMALAALKVAKNAGKDIKMSGVDAMPPAVEAVANGQLVASVRNPSSRIHWGAVVIGWMVANGMEKADDVPKYVLMDGPVVTQKNAAGLLFEQKHFLI